MTESEFIGFFTGYKFQFYKILSLDYVQVAGTGDLGIENITNIIHSTKLFSTTALVLGYLYQISILIDPILS